MASLNLTVASPPAPAALPAPLLAEVNGELESFLAAWDDDPGHDGSTWLTPTRTQTLSALLDQGSDALAGFAPGLPVDEQRRRYSANLRRLQPLLLLWQKQINEAARRMEREAAHQRALRRWLQHQPGRCSR